MSQVNFIITCQPRTGSSYLRLSLNNHSKICCKGEILNHKIIGDEFYKNENLFRAKFKSTLKNLWANRTKPVIGCKIIFEQMLNADKDLVKYINDNCVRVIYLFRKNLLNRLLSNILAQRQEYSKKPYPLEKIVISPRQLLNSIERQKFCHEKFKEFSIKMAVCYEDLFGQKDQTFQNLMKFLGVEYEKVSCNLIKQRTHRQKDYIENYRELKKAFAKTGHAWFFED